MGVCKDALDKMVEAMRGVPVNSRRSVYDAANSVLKVEDLDSGKKTGLKGKYEDEDDEEEE